MAHEIKNPLTPIQLSIDNLRKSIIGNSSIKNLEMSCFTGTYVTGTVNQEYLNFVENEYKS